MSRQEWTLRMEPEVKFPTLPVCWTNEKRLIQTHLKYPSVYVLVKLDRTKMRTLPAWGCRTDCADAKDVWDRDTSSNSRSSYCCCSSQTADDSCIRVYGLPIARTSNSISNYRHTRKAAIGSTDSFLTVMFRYLVGQEHVRSDFYAILTRSSSCSISENTFEKKI